MKASDIINGWCDEVLRERKSNFVFPNVFVGKYEADILEITKSGYAYEYEVKVSRADFKADKKKQGKEQSLLSGRVKQFSYIVPDGMITADEVPGHAGLIYAKEIECGYYDHGSYYTKKRLRFDTVKSATVLSTEKFNGLDKCFLSAYYRFHKYRLNENSNDKTQLDLRSDRMHR